MSSSSGDIRRLMEDEFAQHVYEKKGMFVSTSIIFFILFSCCALCSILYRRRMRSQQPAASDTNFPQYYTHPPPESLEVSKHPPPLNHSQTSYNPEFHPGYSRVPEYPRYSGLPEYPGWKSDVINSTTTSAPLLHSPQEVPPT